MKTFIIAAAIAVTSFVSFAPASYADTVTVTTVSHRQGHDRGWHHPPRRHCYVKTVKVRHHGTWTLRKTRICR